MICIIGKIVNYFGDICCFLQMSLNTTLSCLLTSWNESWYLPLSFPISAYIKYSNVFAYPLALSSWFHLLHIRSDMNSTSWERLMQWIEFGVFSTKITKSPQLWFHRWFEILSQGELLLNTWLVDVFFSDTLIILSFLDIFKRRVLVMEYIDGTPILKLGDEMAKRGISPDGKIAAVARQ